VLPLEWGGSPQHTLCQCDGISLCTLAALLCAGRSQASLRWLSTPTSLALPAFFPHCHLHLIDVFFGTHHGISTFVSTFVHLATLHSHVHHDHAVAPSSCIMQSHLPHASCSRTFLMHHAVAPSSCIMQSHLPHASCSRIWHSVLLSAIRHLKRYARPVRGIFLPLR
jgi:hypothetical protein